MKHVPFNSRRKGKYAKTKTKQKTYASAIGSIMYVMVCSIPDISHAVSVTSVFMGNPRNTHWQAVKWIVRYLNGTLDIGLGYSKKTNDSSTNQGIVDSDFAGNLDKRRSITRYVFTLFGNPKRWKASLQHTIALSTTEEKYVALVDAVKEAIWKQGDVIERGEVQVMKIHTSENHVDMLINAVAVGKYKHCLDLLNIGVNH
ncbi:secreted RxLR effector protein 161-like [Cicer arietinum]|uniref:secreted RxLR effector protein 161-like n=1 Tax=Cicer arietinum TaxID=3827 RepID=UPI003CC518D4